MTNKLEFVKSMIAVINDISHQIQKSNVNICGVKLKI